MANAQLFFKYISATIKLDLKKFCSLKQKTKILNLKCLYSISYNMQEMDRYWELEKYRCLLKENLYILMTDMTTFKVFLSPVWCFVIALRKIYV